MFVKNFGLFWRVDEIDWNPGKGAKGQFRLLGRAGKNLPGLRLANFRHQQGIYILYGNYGPHYVGLTRKQGLGKRLKDHLTDRHGGLWDRFSWFGFCPVLKATDANGLQRLKNMAAVAAGGPDKMIGDVEALLIKSMGLPKNIAQMNFYRADEWKQVQKHEVMDLLKKVRGR